jgi:hypothetical protein
MFSDPDQTAASRLKRCFGVVPTKSTVKTPVLIILSRLNSIPLTVAVYASCQHLCRLRKTRFRWVANPCRTGLNTCRDTKRCFIIFIYICSPYKSPPHGFARRNDFRLSQVFRVERVVTSPLPHRPGRAAFPHPVPRQLVSLK